MNRHFKDIIREYDFTALARRIEAVTPREVESALDRPQPGEGEIAALLSPAAEPHLEQLARRAATLTRRRFGRVIQLYAPLYLSNECVNKCDYCGFSHELDIPRLTLSPAQVLDEAHRLHERGFRHLLLVSGEDRRHVHLDYLEEIVAGLRELFDSIALEIQPLSRAEYERLGRAGVDGLTLYQEIYDPDIYARHHLAGPKRRYDKRLDHIEAGGEAGYRSLGVGALLGLAPWRVEAFMLALHARYLTRRFWQSRIAVSFPRIQGSAHGYQPEHPVSERNLAQMMTVLRLALPDAELVLSTRESAHFRDHAIAFGVTRMSAGSRTEPGGYSMPDEGGEQFEVEDTRSPEQVCEAIVAQGCEPVWKDFDRRFLARDAG